MDMDIRKFFRGDPVTRAKEKVVEAPHVALIENLHLYDLVFYGCINTYESLLSCNRDITKEDLLYLLENIKNNPTASDEVKDLVDAVLERYKETT